MTPIDAVDPSRLLATVALDGVRVDAAHTLGDPGPPTTAAALRRALDTATVALALDAVGAAQQLFDVSLDYVKQREQFGVPVGSFQAIKHKFADLLVLLERARALGYYAALTIAEDDAEQSLATAMAKAAAGDVATRMAKEGIQLHGGIGYTWESDVHLYVRRLAVRRDPLRHRRAPPPAGGGAHRRLTVHRRCAQPIQHAGGDPLLEGAVVPPRDLQLLGPPEVELDVVLEGEADPAEHLLAPSR